MTEEQWLDCTDPMPMLDFLHGRGSDRKLRLFAVACCRHVWHLLTDERGRRAVEVSERFVDGWASRQELEDAFSAADQALHFFSRQARPMSPWQAWQGRLVAAMARQAAHLEVAVVADRVADTAVLAATWAGTGGDHQAQAADEQAHQAVILRDIVGSPFRPAQVDPAWLAWEGGTVPKLAAAIYKERAFDRLPILADALEDAGCDNADLLAHLRGPGPHVRGCRAVDLLLGKG
jgi:hypothetical protein